MSNYTRIPSSDTNTDATSYGSNESLKTPSSPSSKTGTLDKRNLPPLAPVLTQSIKPRKNSSTGRHKHDNDDEQDVEEYEELKEVVSNRLIKLIGVPKPTELSEVNALDSQEPLAVNTLGTPIKPSTNDSEKDSSYHFYQTQLVDVIEAQNEDPFTLESFESLIIAHAERGKDFILARVITADPQDSTKFYYSYYAAHHINKVLFRTQPAEGLLHRMRAKNVKLLIISFVLFFFKL